MPKLNLSIRILGWWLLLSVQAPVLLAQNLRQLTVENGLSGNVVTSLHQSRNGFLWLGTMDGLNVYYGQEVEQASMSHLGFLEGHTIESIVETPNDHIWIQTAYGLHRLSRLTRETTSFPLFTGEYKLRVLGEDKVMVCDKQNRLHLYHPETDEFVDMESPLGQEVPIVDFGGTDTFGWMASPKGIIRYRWQHKPDGTMELTQAIPMAEGEPHYVQSSPQPEVLYVVNAEKQLYKLDIRQNLPMHIMDLGRKDESAYEVSCIAENKGTYFIAYKGEGVYKYTPEGKNWKVENLNIKSEVTQIIKDVHQDLIWIATEGQGVFAYWDAEFRIRSYTYSQISSPWVKPVLSIRMDEEGWLWIGTKGSGLMGIDRTDPSKDMAHSPKRLLTTDNSALENNHVYALAASAHQGFWVGTEGGLNFYHSPTRTLQRIEGVKEVGKVYDVTEVHDSVLWISTMDKGIFRANIERHGKEVRLLRFRPFRTEEDATLAHKPFAMHYSADGNLWMGNRGLGVFQMYPSGLEPVDKPSRQFSQLQNDVSALYAHRDRVWIGTRVGLYGRDKQGQEWYLNKENGIPNNIIHALQVDERDALWMSTHNGIARLDAECKEVKAFGRKEGLDVTEFSDGASSTAKGVVYFGGVNGWVEISNNPRYRADDPYIPQLLFNKFKGMKEIGLDTLNLDTERKEVQEIVLEREENTFSISFLVMDYINYNDYHYLYKVDSEQAGIWIDNGAHTMVSLTQLLPGHYTLSVKYRSRITGYESKPVQLRIHIRPYWWQTPGMKFLYWLVAFMGIIGMTTMYYRKVKRRHAYSLKSMEQRHKEELYEEKLRFFTNITHEFITPLTLIYGPCERMLSHKGSDEYVRKYTLLVRKQAERLNQLIQEIIDYRRIETRHQQLKLERYDLSEYIRGELPVFEELAKKNGICLTTEIEQGVCWNMDRRCFPKIWYNLLSNAIKYTPQGGTVKVTLATTESQELKLKVYNTGKGIKEKDRTRIFDRYSVLDEVEENASNMLLRNGLGMAICHSSVQLLGGTIDINSEVGQYAEFVVTLPLLPLTQGAEEEQTKEMLPTGTELSDKEDGTATETIAPLATGNKPAILVVDDNKDLVDMLREMLCTEYQVYTALDADKALETVHTIMPHLVITDVMMPGTLDGVALTRQMKQDKYTMHIPMVILSARNTDRDKTEGWQAGADAYISKPFHMDYLKAVVARLIESRKDMKEYYSTSASAFSYMEGQLVKSENRDFLYQLNQVIEKNLNNHSITNAEIAEAMNLSPRTFYRKLKELQLPSPKEYIKVYRMEKAEKMLRTSNILVQEVIYECGYNNRSLFYKDFMERNGVSPTEFRNRTRDNNEKNETNKINENDI